MQKIFSGGISIKYVGSKSRVAKYIVPILQELIDTNKIEDYYEPFVGGGNIIDKIRCKNRYGSDINPYLIALFQNLDKLDTLPDMISAREYVRVRDAWRQGSKAYPMWYIGAVGFLASYNGKFFGGYAGIVHTKTGVYRNYFDEAKRNLETQTPSLYNVVWTAQDYTALSDVKNALIYCDIPYQGTTGYKFPFDHQAFWEWADKMSQNNILVVSEENAPDGWNILWEQPIKRTLDKTSRSVAIEKLFSKNVENNLVAPQK